jgi:hypothetical protein
VDKGLKRRDDSEKLPPKRKILKGTGFSPYVNASLDVRL